MKQTGVEWLEEKLQGHLDISRRYWNELLTEAKEMEKEQSIDFARLCLNKAKDLDILTSFMNAEQYYNETFKKK